LSHIATVELEIKSLDDLDSACKRLGLEFVRGQDRYRCYFEPGTDADIRRQARQFFDDDEITKLMPDGFSLADMGRCQHAIRIAMGNPNWQSDAHEIGVVQRRDGKPGFVLLMDGFCDRLTSFVGRAGEKLRQAYATAAATRSARQQGFRVTEHAKADGSIQLQCHR
jgi:hypothetical protein